MNSSRIVFLAIFLLLIPAAADHSATVTFSPLWLRDYDTNTFYITVRNSLASGDPISEVHLINPMNLSVGCGAVPAGWDLASPFGESQCAYATDTNKIAPGETLDFYFFATVDESKKLVEWRVKTKAVDEKYYKFEIRIDAVAPGKPELVLPTAAWLKQRDDTEFEFSVEDNLGGSGIDKCLVLIDLKAVGNLSYSGGKCQGSLILPTMSEGLHTLYVEAYDKAGNTASDSFNLSVDNKAPLITSVSLMDSGAKIPGYFRPGRAAKIVAKISDKGSGFDTSTVYADIASFTEKEGDIEASPTGCTSTGCEWVFTPIEGLGGTFSFRVTASDKVGNTNSATSSATADYIPPIISVSSPANNGVYSLSETSIIFSVSDREGKVFQNSIQVEIDGSKVSQFLPEKYCKSVDGSSYECIFTLSGFLGDGFHTLRVSASDRAGNPAEPVVVEWQVDKNPPVVETAYLRYDPLLNPTGLSIFAKVADRGSGVKKVVARVGEKQVELQKVGQVWQAKLPSELQAGGSVQLVFIATDGAGNSGRHGVESNFAFAFVTWLCFYILVLYLIGKILIRLLGIVKLPRLRVYKYGHEPVHHKVKAAAHHVIHKVKTRLGRGQKYIYRPRK